MDKYVRLPVYDEKGVELPLYVEYSLPMFLQQVPNGLVKPTEVRDVIEWRDIPGFSGYVTSKEGGVMLSDNNMNAYPVPPISAVHTRPRRYNLLGDDGRGHEHSEEYLIELTFPELSI